jgi:hypothetical protein
MKLYDIVDRNEGRYLVQRVEEWLVVKGMGERDEEAVGAQGNMMALCEGPMRWPDCGIALLSLWC